MNYKNARLGPQLIRHGGDPEFFEQVHVLFGGTGAVGGATALQMIGLFEEARRRSPLPAQREPHIIVTGRTHHELRQFTHVLFEVQQRDHGHIPELIDGVGYRTKGGVVVELTIFAVDPSIPGLQDFSQHDDTTRRLAIAAFLAEGGLDYRDMLDAVGLPREQFAPTFAVSRIVPPCVTTICASGRYQ